MEATCILTLGDKPLAIVCNPPYRNQKNIKNDFYKYDIDPSITEIVGNDGAKELFICFLAQIAEICRLAEDHDLPPNSIVLLFTQSGWLTKKPTYQKIRTHFMKKFKLLDGFITNSSEFFDVDQTWPLAVTLWEYKHEVEQDTKQIIKLRNYSDLKLEHLKDLIGDTNKDFDDLSNWGTDELFLKKLERLLNTVKKPDAKFNIDVKKLKDNIPLQSGDGNKQISNLMIEKDYFIGGLCFPRESQLDSREKKYLERIVPIYEENIKIDEKIEKFREENKKIPKTLKKKKYPSFVVQGHPHGNHIGFSESKQPYRNERNFPNDGSHLYFLMDTRFIKMNTSQCLSGVPPKRGHVIKNLDDKGKNLIIGYAMAHSLTGNVPSNFNQFDIWLPNYDENSFKDLFEMSSAFMYANNSCIECEIPSNHPEAGAKRVFVTNPLSPVKNTFWRLTIAPLVSQTQIKEASELIESVDKVYEEWNKYILNNTNYKAKAKLPIYAHKLNKTPLDGWGLFQIEKEIEISNIQGKLKEAFETKKEKLKALKNKLYEYLAVDLDYWNI